MIDLESGVALIHYANVLMKWIERQGGAEPVRERNKRKANKLDAALNRSSHFKNVVAEEFRSEMNVTFFGGCGGSGCEVPSQWQ
jgi:phosphoserine aminotransferase